MPAFSPNPWRMPLEIAFCSIIVVCLLAVSMLSAAVDVGLFLSMLGAVCFLTPFFITPVAIFIVFHCAGVALLFVISFVIELFSP